MLRVIAVVGLIAVLVLGAWGIIQLAFFIPSFLSNLAGGTVNRTETKESLSVAVPVAVNAEQVFPLTWTHKNFSGQYGYTISYACAEGLSVKAPLPNGTWQSVSCNTPFNYINATTTSPITASVAGDKAITAGFTVTATKLSSGAVTSSASANASVAPAKKAATTPAKTTTKSSSTKTSYVPSGRTTNLYGSPDLQVRMLSNPGVVYGGQKVSLQFAIENVGTNIASANWIFTANLPYQGGYTYQSPTQQALYPGDKIVYTLGYTAQGGNQVCTTQYPNLPAGQAGYNCPQPYTTTYDPYTTQWGYPYATLPGYSYPNTYGAAGVQTATITTDPYNMIWESNESNNSASVSYQSY